MSELAPSGGGPNRLFVILALGLGGLLVLGLLGIGGFYLLQRLASPATAVATPTSIRIALSTPTRALNTATAVNSPTEIASPTFVIVAPATQTPGGVSVAAAGTVTTTVGPGTGTPTGGLPDTGLGEDLLLLAGGVVLVLVVFAARRARTVGAA